MIVTEATIRIALGLTTSITDLERAMLQVSHQDAESKIKNHLKYEPEQREHIEFFPRRFATSGDTLNFLNVNRTHTRAVRESRRGTRARNLQLTAIPLRKVTEVKVDENGRFGTGDDAFSSGSEWVEGEDFWPEFDKDNFSPSGILIASGSWPTTPGSVKVTYTSGYSEDELQGTANVDATNPFTTQGVDAVGIRIAVINESMRRFKTFIAQQKNQIAGFLPGALKSERLQDYSYTLTAATEFLVSMTLGLAPESVAGLEPYTHWGLISI